MKRTTYNIEDIFTLAERQRAHGGVTHGLFGQHYLVPLRRTVAGAVLDACGHPMVHYDHRHPHRNPVFQSRFSGILPLWEGNPLRRRSHVPSGEYPVAYLKRDSAGHIRHIERHSILLYDYRDSFRAAVLQDCEACPYAIRGDGVLARRSFRGIWHQTRDCTAAIPCSAA